VSGNAAERKGGGIWCYWSSPVIVSSIVWGNTGGGGSDNLKSCGRSVRASFSAIGEDSYKMGRGSEPWPGKGNIKADPMFRGAPRAEDAPAEGGDYRLMTDSPCIDSGSVSGVASRDIDGNPRPFGGGGDMGAYELPGKPGEADLR